MSAQHDDDFVMPLRKPVTIGSGDAAITYTELHLREPEAGELEKATKESTNVGVSITLIQLIAGIPRKAAEKLSQRDLREASDYLGGFTPDGQESGPTP